MNSPTDRSELKIDQLSVHVDGTDGDQGPRTTMVIRDDSEPWSDLDMYFRLVPVPAVPADSQIARQRHNTYRRPRRRMKGWGGAIFTHPVFFSIGAALLVAGSIGLGLVRF